MLRELFQGFSQELAPFPGRFALTWRIALLSALVAGVAMVYEIIEPAIGCYLIIYLMKPNAAETIVMGIGALVLVTIVVAGMFGLANLTIESPPLRLATMAFFSFLFVYLGSASRLGPLGSDIALVIVFVLSLLSFTPFGEAVDRVFLYAWQMVAMPMAMMVGFNMVLGRPPQSLLRETIGERLRAAAAALLDGDGGPARLKPILAEGNAEHNQRALLARALHYVPDAESAWLARGVENSYRLLLAISALPASVTQEWRGQLAARCTELAEAVAARREAAPFAPVPETAPGAAQEASSALQDMARGDQSWPKMPQPPFFSPDALSNPNHQRLALKTTAAALACYMIYTGLQWQGIETAMVTCYVAALGTTGETVHKLALRIAGCLVGAAMGIGSILFLIPHMTSVGSLMALVFLALLPAAWISTGSERFAYGGVQIGLAFLLTVLHGFGPSLDMDTATNRIIGILLGNVMIYLVFTRIWPVGLVTTLRHQLSDALQALSRLALLAPGQRSAAVNEASQAMTSLDAARLSIEYTKFEPRGIRPDPHETERLGRLVDEAEKLTVRLFLSDGSPAEVERLRQLLAAPVAEAAAGAPPVRGPRSAL